tara:strand:- start:341 stop:679 length:339 start_codon:yes stop_codon:yes gene_type:complete
MSEQKVEVRVLKSGEKYSIQEVYFNGEEPFAHSVDLMVEGESIEELHEQLSQMISSLRHPPVNEIKSALDSDDTDTSETYIYESPDGGKTIYRRAFGEEDREIVNENQMELF